MHDAGGRLENLLSSCEGEKGEHTDVDESRPGVLDSRVEFLFPVRDERRLLITRYHRTNRFKGNGFEAISNVRDKTSRPSDEELLYCELMVDMFCSIYQLEKNTFQ